MMNVKDFASYRHQKATQSHSERDSVTAPPPLGQDAPLHEKLRREQSRIVDADFQHKDEV